MNEGDQPVVYKSRRLIAGPTIWAFLTVCFAGLALAIPSPSSPVLRWLLLAIACLMLIVSLLLQIILGFTSIQISSKGIEICHWRFQSWSLEWSDITEFFPERLLGRNHVAFTLSPAGVEKMRSKRFAGIPKGRLPDTYGFTAEALARLLNEQRKLEVGE
jgi:hypothetical protein